jgi:hypothetical protein
MEEKEFRKQYERTLRDFGDVLVVLEPREDREIREIIMTDDYDIIDDKVILYRRGRKKRVADYSEIIEVY